MSSPISRTLARALEIIGDKARLAAALGISDHELDQYLQGEQPLPNRLFLAALDIVAGPATPER